MNVLKQCKKEVAINAFRFLILFSSFPLNQFNRLAKAVPADFD
jgi:hypothetical protein